ncbi:actin binding protein [Planoprotostelium fungivorum]|uniref:Actin binding protein n=1 Tax=Planoprotostelium fungivorum TaxID=1890364 RepID=A0A2P6N306_9EUKA|nr:actin binding protein [Planoprotostelium fungivorum]
MGTLLSKETIDTSVQTLSSFVPSLGWVSYQAPTEDQVKKEKMDCLVRELRHLFDKENLNELREDDIQFIEDATELDDDLCEESWIEIDRSEDDVSSSDGGERFVTWYDHFSRLLIFARVLPDSEATPTPLKDHHAEKVAELEKQLNDMQDIKFQLEAVKQQFQQILTASALQSSRLYIDIPSVEATPPSTTSQTPIPMVEDAPASEAPVAPPPPPPPAPPGPQTETKGLPKIRSLGIMLVRPEAKEKTRADIEREVKSLIDDSDIININKPRALDNFLRLFPANSVAHTRVLERMLTDYSFLIRQLPLQPQTCYKRFKLWEDQLFKRVEQEEGKDKVTALRKKKAIQIEKLNTSNEIREEVSRTIQFLANERKKEAEREKEKARGKLMNSMVGELKDKLVEVKQKDQLQQAQKELENIESTEIVIE